MKRLLVVLAATLAAVLGLGVGSASAHSALVGSDPAAGASVSVGPQTARLTFNEALQTQFASMTVVGPDGNLWSKGEPTIDGPNATVPVGELGPTGTYTIAYRVTSADGHPVSGTVQFTLTEPGNGTPGPAANPNKSDDDSGSSFPVWIPIAGGALVLVVALALVLRATRKR